MSHFYFLQWLVAFFSAFSFEFAVREDTEGEEAEEGATSSFTQSNRFRNYYLTCDGDSWAIWPAGTCTWRETGCYSKIGDGRYEVCRHCCGGSPTLTKQRDIYLHNNDIDKKENEEKIEQEKEEKRKKEEEEEIKQEKREECKSLCSELKDVEPDRNCTDRYSSWNDVGKLKNQKKKLEAKIKKEKESLCTKFKLGKKSCDGLTLRQLVIDDEVYEKEECNEFENIYNKHFGELGKSCTKEYGNVTDQRNLKNNMKKKLFEKLYTNGVCFKSDRDCFCFQSDRYCFGKSNPNQTKEKIMEACGNYTRIYNGYLESRYFKKKIKKEEVHLLMIIVVQMILSYMS